MFMHELSMYTVLGTGFRKTDQIVTRTETQIKA